MIAAVVSVNRVLKIQLLSHKALKHSLMGDNPFPFKTILPLYRVLAHFIKTRHFFGLFAWFLLPEYLLPSETNDLKYRNHSKSICSERDDRIIKWPIPLHLVADHVGDSPQTEKASACRNLNQADTSLSSLTTNRKSREQLQVLGRKPELQVEKVIYFPEFLDSASKNAN